MGTVMEEYVHIRISNDSFNKISVRNMDMTLTAHLLPLNYIILISNNAGNH
jgi:hypothetical protein